MQKLLSRHLTIGAGMSVAKGTSHITFVSYFQINARVHNYFLFLLYHAPLLRSTLTKFLS